MPENRFPEDYEDIRELLRRFDGLKSGKVSGMLQEESFERIIDHFDDQDDLEKAMDAVIVGLEHYPFSSTLMVKKADLLIANGAYTDGLRILEHALALDANDIDIYILKTDAYLALDQQEKAVQVIREALDRFKGQERLELLFELADVYDDYEEFDKIFDCLRLILQEDPNNEEALYKICFWTDFTGRNEESIRLHRWIIDESPYNDLAWFNLGAAYQGLKLYEKSIDAYQYAITINEKFDFAYRNIADAYMRLRKYRDAIEALEKVVELSRPEDVIYEALGLCFDKIGHFAQARLYYRKASHINPDDAMLFRKVAATYMQEENWQQAIKYLESALRISRLNPEFNLAMGDCLFQLRNLTRAAEFYTISITQRPKNVRGWQSMIRCLYTAGDFQGAVLHLDMAEQKAGTRPVFLYYRCALLLAMGRTKDALIRLQEAVKIAPSQLRRLLELEPGILTNPAVVEILARLRKRPRH